MCIFVCQEAASSIGYANVLVFQILYWKSYASCMLGSQLASAVRTAWQDVSYVFTSQRTASEESGFEDR